MTVNISRSALDISMAPTNNSTAKALFSFPRAKRFENTLKPLYFFLLFNISILGIRTLRIICLQPFLLDQLPLVMEVGQALFLEVNTYI